MNSIDFVIIAITLALLFYGRSKIWYVLKVILAWGIIKPLADLKILCFNTKESRESRVNTGEVFHDIPLTKMGYCQLYQYSKGGKSNTRERQYFKSIIHPDNQKLVAIPLDENDEGYDKQDGGRRWVAESHKWYVVENPGFKLETWEGLSGWQQFCLSELGVYWFGGSLLQRKLQEMKLEIYKLETIDVAQVQDGKTIFVPEVRLKIVEPQTSIWLYSLQTEYAFEVPFAEDVNGNAVNVKFSVMASNVNGYISWVENERWDKNMKTIAVAAAIEVILKHPFSNIHIKYKDDKSGSAAQKNIIAGAFSLHLLEVLNNFNDGFLYHSVNLADVSVADPALAKLNFEKYKSEVNILMRTNAGIAEAKYAGKIGDTKNRLLKIESEIISKNLQAAKIATFGKTLSNLKVLGGDSVATFIDLKDNEKDDTGNEKVSVDNDKPSSKTAEPKNQRRKK